MASILKTLKLISDPSRLRLLLLLEREELSVAELQEILSMGQSRISTHLSQLKAAGIVEDRKQGKNSLYRLRDRQLIDLLHSASSEIPETKDDARALQLALEKRRDKVRGYFDELAGKFGRNYVPGRSWKGLAETLLQLMPPMTIADLGAGEGTFCNSLPSGLSMSSRWITQRRWWNSERGWRVKTDLRIWNTGWAIWNRRRSKTPRSISHFSVKVCTTHCIRELLRPRPRAY